ncbi:hypothetical protein WMY93_028594 [Mugilogobius chulae]|uniref:DNA repair protein REV1 n=1 Tax=Mugilogobius chulae TaxID=88201 RepID=A0AAW0MQP3_9GOBI
MSRDGWMKKKSNAGDDNGWAEAGGYMAAKVSKLDEQFKLAAPREKLKEGTSSTIFSGISIYVNGYTDPSADELRRLMMLHGGQFHLYYRHSKTTHIIANNLPNSKIQDLKGEKVIRPEWITDSVKAGRLLPYLKYQLYAKGKSVLFTGITFRQDKNVPDSIQTLPQPNVGQNISLPHSINTLHKNVVPNYAKNHTCLQLQSSSSTPQDKRLGHPQPQMNSLRCQNGVDVTINGHAKVLLDTSHLQLAPNEDSSLLRKVPLTNGHTRLNNSALRHEDLSSVAEPSDLFESKTRVPHYKCHVTSIDPHSKSDPYDFPHSPETPFEKDFEAQDQLCVDVNNKVEPQTVKTTSCPSLQEPETSVDGEKAHVLLLNESYHNISDRSSANNKQCFTEHMLSESSSQLQAQTDNLISEFYSHSRLHQISTWRTAFSEYVNELHCKRRTSGTPSFPGKDSLRRMKIQGSCSRQVSVKSCIFHVDMDCFFVSVGIRHRPDLKGQSSLRPGTNPQLEKKYYEEKHNHAQHKEDGDLHRNPSQEGPGLHTNGVEQDATGLSMAEIASCSYEARQAGVKNGMFFGKAKQLCPLLQAVPYDFEAYKQVALTMYETLAGYTHDIEALSCDEVLIDATSVIKELEISPHDLASAIRADIEKKTGCCASVGMASNILLARLATRKAKPNGQYFLKSEQADDFIRDLAVTSLPGVGPAMGRKLAAIGVKSCGDLQQVSMSVLQKKFGPRTGQTLFRFCRGLDDRPVRYEKERKSVSAEMNYNIRFTRIDEAECFLTNLSMEVQKRLKVAGLRGRRVTLKVMIRKVGAPIEPAKYGGHGICDNIARTVMLAQSTDNGQLIATAVIKLFHAMKLQVQDLRGVGIQVQLLDSKNSVTQDYHTRSIKELLKQQGQAQCPKADTSQIARVMLQESSIAHVASVEPVPETSKEQARITTNYPQSHLRLSIEVPSPSQVDRKLNGQISPKQSTFSRPHFPSPSDSPKSSPGKLILQIPNQPENTGIVLELPNFSQIDPEVFAALPKELQDEIKSAYCRTENTSDQLSEVRNPLLQLKQAGAGPVRVKRQYKRKNTSPAKSCLSPIKKQSLTISPANTLPSPIKQERPVERLKTENSSLKQNIPEPTCASRAPPALAGASEWTDIKTLLREWVTTITEPMEEDILQVVKYCTDLIEDKDLEKLDLVIKYMKRLMKLSVESVWSMAFDFIVDNVQVVLQQTYGSTLKMA